MAEKPKPKPPKGDRIPAAAPSAAEQGKRYAKAARRLVDAGLTVTASDGPVAKLYAPGRLAGGLAQQVTSVISAVSGGSPPAFYGALGGASMTLFFGDPVPDDGQEELPIGDTAAHAARVGALIDTDGDELYRQAVTIGPPAEKYTELARFVGQEGFTLTWRAAGDAPHILIPTRASEQVGVLSKPPKMTERTMTVYGELYRVITDRKPGQLGTVGIHLFGWSSHPPARRGAVRQTVIAPYARDEVEQAIKAGLIGEPVKADILIRMPRPGASIDPENVVMEVVKIEPGPTEASRLGVPMFDDE